MAQSSSSSSSSASTPVGALPSLPGARILGGYIPEKEWAIVEAAPLPPFPIPGLCTGYVTQRAASSATGGLGAHHHQASLEAATEAVSQESGATNDVESQDELLLEKAQRPYFKQSEGFLGNVLDRFNECWNEWRSPNGRIPLYEKFPRLSFLKGDSKKAVFAPLSFNDNLPSPPAPTPSQSQESVRVATTPPHTISHHPYYLQSILNPLPFPKQSNIPFHIDNSLRVHHYHISPLKEDA